jgi:hypothetical protein
MKKSNDVDDYIAAAPEEDQNKLREVRNHSRLVSEVESPGLRSSAHPKANPRECPIQERPKVNECSKQWF